MGVVINIDDVRSLYQMIEKSPDGELREQLRGKMHQIFDEDTLYPRDVTERVKTFGHACSELGSTHPLIREWKRWEECPSANLAAYLKLRIIVAALNEGWEPTFKPTEHRYTPWFDIHSDGGFRKKPKAGEKPTVILLDGYQTESVTATQADSSCVRSMVGINLSHRLCLKTAELATYCGDQFISLWMDLCLPRKQEKLASNNRDRGEIGMEAI